MLLTATNNYRNALEEFIRSSKVLTIIVPFIRKEVLEELLEFTDRCTQIVFRGRLHDFVSGQSDLDVYHTCRERGITLFRHPDIHLKAFVDNFERCLHGSANISQRALGHGEPFNYELGTISAPLSFTEQRYFYRILSESQLVTEDWVVWMREQHLQQLSLPTVKEPTEPPQEKESDTHFLLSVLPMSDSPRMLNDIYMRSILEVNPSALRCAAHDLALYRIPDGLDSAAFHNTLRQAFFTHPFIRAFRQALEANDGQYFFGRVKDWIQAHTTTVPLPRKWELTPHVQVIYKWFVQLGDGAFEVDIPGKHSERLIRTSGLDLDDEHREGMIN